MKLTELLQCLNDNNLYIPTDIEFIGITNDSRQVQPGDLFLAYPGATVDGRLYIDVALAKGAAAVVYDDVDNFSFARQHVPAIACPRLMERMGVLASKFYSNPSTKLRVIGITGTNGKTTIAYQLAQALQLLGEKSYYIGTLGIGEPSSIKSGVNTTPDGLQLQKILSQCVGSGINWVVMEVSSHALAENRVAGMCFETAIFTNLTRDHLDYHGTMENYAAAKSKLFSWSNLKNVILNIDDVYSDQMYAAIKSKNVTVCAYSVENAVTKIQADMYIYADQIQCLPTETRFVLNYNNVKYPITIRSLGAYNISNSLALIGSLIQANFPISRIQEILPQIQSASGRLELVATRPIAMVDFAHTPDALENVLKTLNAIKRGRLILVFGCGGDRDPGKRPIMGNVASRLADVLFVTSDNPRGEDPDTIAQQIISGIELNKQYFKELDRAQAIFKALSMAGEEDVVLVAGKGHETYQQIGIEKQYFSDQEEILKFIQNMNL